MNWDGNGYTQAPADVLEELNFFVKGTPTPQGSKTLNRGGGSFRESNKNLPAWRAALVKAAKEMVNDRPGFPPHEPIYCSLQFFMPRGKTVTRKFPTTKPDVDKLERAVLDAMTIAGVWADDAQVVSGPRGKRYADECEPGVRITIRSAR